MTIARGRFQHFVAIDWSGAKGERHHGIKLALCGRGRDAPDLIRPEHRWSRVEVLRWLLEDCPRDALIGFDLSPGLPFADAGAFFPGWVQSPASAQALWQLVDDLCRDDPHLEAGSFLKHPEARRHFRLGQGELGDLFAGGAGRMRLTEERQRAHRLAPSSCFNLVGAAQVGKSSLTGMRLLHQLGGAIPVWPFDPLPGTGSVIVEIYTSLAAREAAMRPGRSKMMCGEALDTALAHFGVSGHRALPRYSDHATDAILTSAWLRYADDNPALWAPAGLSKVAATEGWTFGVQ